LAGGNEAGLRFGTCDLDLKEQLVRDDDEVLGLILRTYGPAIAAVLQRRYLVLNEHDIEDVLASALFRLWRFRKRLDVTRGSLATLLLRIADNIVRDLFKEGWRKLRLHEAAAPDPAELPAVLVPEPAAEKSAAENDRVQQDVRAIIDRLPDAYRFIVLADANARERVASAEMISEELEIPAGTVRVYRNRAMAAIRRELRQLGYKVP
jgi:RNA polymerase sigma factor (sigma-70 family)